MNKIVLPLLFFVSVFAGAQDNETLDWENLRLNVSASLNLKMLGVRMPSGRVIAEENIRAKYRLLAKTMLYTIQVDSSTTAADLAAQGVLTTDDIEDVILKSKTTAAAMSADLQNIQQSGSVDLKNLAAKITRQNSARDFMKVLNPPQAPLYTGIVIIADSELPVHGHYSSAYITPCMFPKIWDSDMNLIFEQKNLDADFFNTSVIARYRGRAHIFARNASGMSDEILQVIGSRPLRIIARGLFGAKPTDIIIDNEDAMQILANEGNKNLLREGRLVIIIPETSLEK